MLTVPQYMVRYFLSILMTLVLIVASANIIGCSGSKVTSREGSIKGRILNSSGKVVDGALITWAYDETRWAQTDENGEYMVNNVSFGEQDFYVQAFGYNINKFNSVIYSGKTTTAEDFVIYPKSFDYLDIEVKEISATNAVISWKTTDYTNAIVEYGETEGLGRTVRENENVYSTTHSIKLIDLKPETDYFFRIVSNREGRDSEISSKDIFTTLNSLEDNSAPTAPTGVSAALTSYPNQATIFWAPVTDPDLKGYKVYRSEIGNASFEEVDSIIIPRGQEQFIDRHITPGKKYYYRVTAIDQAENESGFSNTPDILIPGSVTSSVRWFRANSPYILNGDLTILETGKISIDNGVEIRIAETDAFRLGDVNKIEIVVNGAISASATQDLPIIFAAEKSNPDKGYWGGIRFENVSNTENTFVNVVVSDAETGISIIKSQGIFSNIKVINCDTALVADNNNSIELNAITSDRCTTGMILKNNENLIVTNSTFLHPILGISSQLNSGLKIISCNFLEYVQNGLISDEVSGKLEFTNNLFVSPQGTAIKLLNMSPTIAYNTFDSPFAIHIVKGSPVIEKNLFMTSRSVFPEGKEGIKYDLEISVLPVVGPNNMIGFANGLDYINCNSTTDSSSEKVLLMKERTGDIYDYRQLQPFPNLDDPWGISRHEIPFEV